MTIEAANREITAAIFEDRLQRRRRRVATGLFRRCDVLVAALETILEDGSDVVPAPVLEAVRDLLSLSQDISGRRFRPTKNPARLLDQLFEAVDLLKPAIRQETSTRHLVDQRS